MDSVTPVIDPAIVQRVAQYLHDCEGYRGTPNDRMREHAAAILRVSGLAEVADRWETVAKELAVKGASNSAEIGELRADNEYLRLIVHSFEPGFLFDDGDEPDDA